MLNFGPNLKLSDAYKKISDAYKKTCTCDITEPVTFTGSTGMSG